MNHMYQFYLLIDETSNGIYVELFVNFEEGLSKVI